MRYLSVPGLNRPTRTINRADLDRLLQDEAHEAPTMPRMVVAEPVEGSDMGVEVES